MERRFNRNLSSETKRSLSLQKKLAESKRTTRQENAPDLTDFMNDMFFGTINIEKKTYNLTGSGDCVDDDDEDFDSSTRSVSSISTQEWLEEAKRMVAASPPRYESPSRLVGSPRFATSRALSASTLDRRDPLSRSARRHKAVEGFSGEILSKSAKHARNNSETKINPPPAETSPALAVQKWISNIVKPPHNPTNDPKTRDTSNYPTPTILPQRQSTHSKSRFQTEPHTTMPIQTDQLSKRTFKNSSSKNAPSTLDTQLLSPPKSSHQRTISSSTCSVEEVEALSPPRNLVESAHRRSISSSTCFNDKIVHKTNVGEQVIHGDSTSQDLNGFLKEKKSEMEKISSGLVTKKAKIVLSGPSNSTSSMVAAICYARLLENRMRANRDREEGDGESVIVVPLMNMKRQRMWKQRQAAWLFHHVGLDATALLFSDEVDLETLVMAKRSSILVVGRDILRIKGEVGSECTLLTDNYCEDAYDLLQTTIVKKLLLAGILIDTQNLNPSTAKSTTRDAEAIQLLSVGSAPDYRNDLFDQLMLDQTEKSFLEVLRHNYGKPPNESNYRNGAIIEHQIADRDTYHEAITASDKRIIHMKNTRANTVSPKSGKSTPSTVQAATTKTADASSGKNKFFLAKWFGFGSK